MVLLHTHPLFVGKQSHPVKCQYCLFNHSPKFLYSIYIYKYIGIIIIIIIFISIIIIIIIIIIIYYIFLSIYLSIYLSICLSIYLSIYLPLPRVQVRSDSLAVLMDRIAVQAPHLFTTPGALTFVISQVERLAPRIQGWKIMKTPGFGCFGMKHVPMFFDSDAGVIWVFGV